jgi:hypothetical protein
MVLEITEQRLLSTKARIDRYIDQNIMTWATEEILLPGQTDIANSIHQKAADGLALEKTGFMKVDLTWEYLGPEGQPIHFYLEYGTKPHVIMPKGKSSGGADWLHWKGPSGGFVIGQDHFAKRVNHPGTEAKKLVEGIKDERTPNLQQRVIKETNRFLEVESI